MLCVFYLETVILVSITETEPTSRHRSLLQQELQVSRVKHPWFCPTKSELSRELGTSARSQGASPILGEIVFAKS